MKYLGIDWATDVHFVALLAGDGEVLKEWQVEHRVEAVGKLTHVEHLLRNNVPRAMSLTETRGVAA